MKVALVHTRYRPDGGAEKAVVHTLNALALRGAEVKIITRGWVEGEGVVQVISCNPFYMGRLWRKWGFIREAKKILSELQVDIVQSQVRLSGCDIYRAGGGVHRELLRQRDRISNPLRRLLTSVSTYHGYKLHAERKMYADARLKAVICNSRMVGDEIVDYYRVPREKIHVIYNAVDHEKFDSKRNMEQRRILRSKLGFDNDQTVFLFVGSGFERKGVSVLLDCMAALPKDCFLMVVGKESRIGKYYRKSRRLGISERVIFAGMQKDVVPYYAAADAFVLPTLYDAFANSVLEAMAASLPVITSFKCGAVDIIENERNGFVCDALDTRTIIRYMHLMRDPAVRKSIGDAGRTTVAGFTTENMSKKLYTLYEKILD